MLWSLGDTSGPDSPLVLAYPYWEQPAPTRWEEDGSYVQTDHAFSHNVTYEWNHGLGEIVTALLEQRLRITQPVSYTHLDVYKRQLAGVRGATVTQQAHAETLVVHVAPGADVTAAVLAALTGIRVGRVITREPTLEDAYVELVSAPAAGAGASSGAAS